MTRRCTEAEVPVGVVANLIAQGYAVYSEIELQPRGLCADIVARCGPVLSSRTPVSHVPHHRGHFALGSKLPRLCHRALACSGTRHAISRAWRSC
jgi:hypothetical protein